MAQGRRRKRRRKAKQKVNIFGLVLVLAVICAAAFASFNAFNFIVSEIGGSIYEKSDEKILKYIDKQTKKEVYLPNIAVDGIDIGGMTKEDAQKKLNSAVKLPTSDVAVIIADDNNRYTKTYTLADFGINFDLDGAIADAYNYARVGSNNEKLESFKMLQNNKQDFQVMSYDEAKIKSIVDGIAAGINVAPVDAAVKKSGGEFVVTPSVIGYSMDAQLLYNKVLEAVENRQFESTVSFTITQNNPRYTEDDFKYIDNEIGSCYSSYKKGDANRIANLENGCNKIDGVVLYPDEVFSTNAHFNPCTYENGWRNAGTIVNGKIEDSIGGGMCQVSSALYQAVLEAELEIVERFNHSLKVGYADYAYDATLAGDYKDLKFKNNTGYPMYIEGFMTSSNVVVRLYGYEKHDASRRLQFRNKLIKTTPPGEPKVTEDNTKPEGYEEYTTTALDGRTYELYKDVYENGALVETVKVNTSTYLPRRAEVTKGTKKPEVIEPTTTEPVPAQEAPENGNPQEVIMDQVVDGAENLS